jgi:hypothetical protein
MRIPKLCSLLAAAALAGACTGEGISYPELLGESLTATLSGANEVPAVTTTATGSAIFAIVNDTILSYRVDVVDIDSVTASHIHLGAAGVPGGVIVTLFTGPGTCNAGTIASPRCRRDYTGAVNAGQIKASQMTQLPATFGTTIRARYDSLLVLMRNGGVYVNVHTRANGGGELRGQTQPQ